MTTENDTTIRMTSSCKWRHRSETILFTPDNLLLSTFLSPEVHRPIPDIPEMDIPEIENEDVEHVVHGDVKRD